MGNNQETFIEGVARDAGASPDFVDTLKREAAERVLVNHLLALRGARGISQEEIAKHFGCSQSKISKLENGVDVGLRIGDLLQYCDAIGLGLSVGLLPKGSSSIDRIKQHAFCIQGELSALVDLADGDETMASGLARTLGEVVFNLVKLVVTEANKLPKHPNTDAPRILIEARCEITDAPSQDSNVAASGIATITPQAIG